MAKVLIVDDSIVIRKLIRIIFTKLNHEVVAEVSDGYEGFLKYKMYMPDLVTMDVLMPIMNGLECLKKILNKFPDAKVIMISALDHKDLVFEALEIGAKHYIIKPINESKIVEVFDEVVFRELEVDVT